MIGHRLNGCTIVAASPIARDTYVILAIADDKDPARPGSPYVVATMGVREMPKPTWWRNGSYFDQIEDATAAYIEVTTATTPKLVTGCVRDFLLWLEKED